MAADSASDPEASGKEPLLLLEHEEVRSEPAMEEEEHSATEEVPENHAAEEVTSQLKDDAGTEARNEEPEIQESSEGALDTPTVPAAPGLQQGDEEEEGVDDDPLAAFIAKITTAIQDTVLGSPAADICDPPSLRRSARIAKGPNSGVPIETAAREAVARRLGSLPPSTSFSERLLQAYLALFDGPLSDLAIQAIEELVLTLKKTKKALPVLGAKAAKAGRQDRPLVVA